MVEYIPDAFTLTGSFESFAEIYDLHYFYFVTTGLKPDTPTLVRWQPRGTMVDQIDHELTCICDSLKYSHVDTLKGQEALEAAQRLYFDRLVKTP